MDKIKAALKSKTFYGGLAFAIIKYLETAQIITPDLSNMLQPLMVALGLYGARNAKSINKNQQHSCRLNYDMEGKCFICGNVKQNDPEKTEVNIGPSIKANV